MLLMVRRPGRGRDNPEAKTLARPDITGQRLSGRPPSCSVGMFLQAYAAAADWKQKWGQATLFSPSPCPQLTILHA